MSRCHNTQSCSFATATVIFTLEANVVGEKCPGNLFYDSDENPRPHTKLWLDCIFSVTSLAVPGPFSGHDVGLI